MDQAFQERVEFMYDQSANVTQSNKTDDHITTYIWSYNNTLPVAVIQNATRTQVESAVLNLGSTFIDDLAVSNDLTDIGNKVSQLWGEVTSDLPDALITAYTHIPGVGVAWIMEPSGKRVHFHYDEFSRLQMVKDQNGNILTEYAYNYKQ